MYDSTTKRSFSTLKIYGAPEKRNEVKTMLGSAMPAQSRSSTTAPSTSLSVRPYEAATSYTSYAAPGFSGHDSRTSGYGTHIPPTLAAEAFKKQQEDFARATELRQMLSNLEKVNDDNRRTSLLDTLCSTEDILNLPEHPNPPGIASGELRVDLLKHQVCGRPFVQGVCRYSILPPPALTEASVAVGN